jgi:hypothetical protein
MRAFLLSVVLASACSAAGVMEEGLRFLNRLASMGYEGVFIMPMEVSILEPCSLKVLMNPYAGDGFFMALGGANVLDLSLSVSGDGWMVVDSFPDDFPVLELTAPRTATVSEMVVCATDMINNADRDSVVVMYAISVVDRPETADDVPSEQDSTGVQ